MNTNADAAFRILEPGTAIRVASVSGRTYECTFIAAGAGQAGLYVRLKEGKLGRLSPERLLPTTLEIVARPGGGTPALVRANDELFLGASERRARVLRVDARGATILTDTGTVELDEHGLAAAQLLFPAPDVRRGDRFIVKSRSGRSYSGRAMDVARDRIVVDAPDGGVLPLRLDQLDPKTLFVLVPLSPVSW